MPALALAALALSLSSLLVGLGAVADADPLSVAPGLYEIEVRLGLPNVLEVAPPTKLAGCLTGAEIESGRAFFVRSESPLRACALTDYTAAGTAVRYRIGCPGPNAASAEAEFETTPVSYRGVIRMQMGGKNMTMSETQVAVRVGDCEPR
jgi:uncharacterized protein DUF3617